jgi:hypothetical protein
LSVIVSAVASAMAIWPPFLRSPLRPPGFPVESAAGRVLNDV